MELSTTPWQFVSDTLASRPTSSVLSSCSDTEEDEAPLTSTGGVSTTTHSAADDDRTIVVNMNSALHEQSYFGTAANSSLVFPDFSMPSFTAGAIVPTAATSHKVLIIGHRKMNFYRALDPQLRHRFTLDNRDPFKVVVVIFDGLIKIGNILNFIKHNNVENKLFVPVAQNISYKIIEKLLKLYKIQLLCMPIPLDDEVSLKNLLDLLSEDFLLEDSLKQRDLKYGIVPASLGNRLLDDGSGSVTMTHHMESMRKSKKLRRKQRTRNYSLIGLGISLGIGIGVTIALTLSYYRALNSVPMPTQIEKPKGVKYALKSLVRATNAGLRNGDEMVKNGFIQLKRGIAGVSKVVLQGTMSYVEEVTCVLDGPWKNTDPLYMHLLDV